jgi:hypothetical protein
MIVLFVLLRKAMNHCEIYFGSEKLIAFGKSNSPDRLGEETHSPLRDIGWRLRARA